MKKAIIYLAVASMLITACHTADNDFNISDSSLSYLRGVNFSTWFESPSPRAIPFTRFTEQDFKNVKSIGVDIIRLPINLHSMTDGAPDYRLNSLFLHFLDQVVGWAEKHKIYLILDNHSFDPVAATDPDIENILIPVWIQMAERYKNRSKYIMYEILNEPHGIDAQLWGEIQGRVAAAIRGIDTVHSIIVGGVDYNSIDRLFDLPEYDFNNIIYTFHFYDPYLFTHQGETWGSPPNLRTLAGMPFPSDAHALPELSDELKGTWVESSINYSYMQDATVQAMAKQLDKAVSFSQERGGVPLFCGEFGVHIPNCLPEDRVRWYQETTQLLDDRRISRTSWDYFGGFGIFKTDQGGLFNSDLNVDIVKAMGFSPPPQKPAKAILNAFTIFDNYPASLADISHWSCDLDLYYQNGSKFAISWGNADRYGTFSLNFRQKIDWDYLQSNGYAITFTAKTDNDARFDVRFLNREDSSSIPWRLYATTDIAADGQWHTVRIPLSEMREQGAWINATEEWRNPEGKFSWTDIVSLSFVAEEHDLHGVTVLFDTIKVER